MNSEIISLQIQVFRKKQSLRKICLCFFFAIKNMLSVKLGTAIHMEAQLVNFKEDDVCEYQWYYSPDDGETYIEIPSANQQFYEYLLDAQNCFYRWRIVVTIANAEAENDQ